MKRIDLGEFGIEDVKEIIVGVIIMVGVFFLLGYAQYHLLNVAGVLCIALSAGAGLGVGLAFSNGGKLRETRLWDDTVLYGGGAPWVVVGLGFLALTQLGRLHLTWPVTILFGFFAFIVAYRRGVVPAEPDKPNTFGTASWATLDYLRAHRLVGNRGIRLGAISGAGASELLSYTSDRHLLTIAPTRSGKGVTAIIPNLLTYEGSALVIDPKGENAMVTAAARAAMGQHVHMVDPWLIAPDASARPARFNPLDWLVRGDVDMTENAMLLADALVVPQGHGERFWSEEAKAMLQGFILYVATDDREQDERTLGRVRDLLLLDGDDMQRLFERMAQSPHHVVASTGARCLQKEERLLANVLASAQAETHFLDSTRIRESLSASDFKFEDLKTQRMTIYLVLPADRLNAFGRWLRLLIQQAITVNARNIETQPEKPILFLLDEMPALGRLSMLEQAFGLMAGFGMQLWGIVQDASQLKRIYGDGWETFIGNSGAIQYFGSRDRMTAEYFSALCGVTTEWNVSSATSKSVGGGNSGMNRSTSTTETTSAVQRKLAFADELMRLPADQQLVLIENHPPIRANKSAWFRDPGLAARGRNLHLSSAHDLTWLGAR